MLLGNLLSGKEISNLIVLQDTIDASARPLLLCFVKSLLDRVDLVCLVCYEHPPSKFLKSLDAELQSRVECFDACTDYLKWNQDKESDEQNHLVHHDSDLINTIRKAINKRCSLNQNGEQLKVAIAMDSVSNLILQSVSNTCQMLHQLLQSKAAENVLAYKVEQIVCVVHSDLHENHIVHAFVSIATSILQISPLDQSQTDPAQGCQSEEVENYCKVLHIRRTGKVLKKRQRFLMNQQFEVKEFQEEDWTQKPEILKISEPEADPTANLPFNLKLTKQEEQARANTQLPYMHHTNTSEPLAGKESQIFYQPDDVDDFDEDDPDDDLDI
ncbi:elongator complex protein 5-like [Actinia tenebrosa]|uniref:Elongator complex protein 5 n=1 Tax=Actinia tenebrosa TaxID=6105 RepID=A0A6P8HP67_ACTTE|nr:elongator complex protein 5-like [Actinia tenebrosa]